METDDLNKSSKIVIFIYIFFIVSYVSHIVRYFVKASVLTNIISQR